ncbi:hypothetical protein [Flavobacterium sp. 3HN19-14]|uniref:hypothetical protein n=1 Tax=Flavobacterium sp. 3HN19-14 TaxID=3448133 RepID=UPI003EE2821C
MTKKNKALLYNFLGFAFLYIITYFLLATFTYANGILKPVIAAVAASLLAPKFQSVKTANGEKIFMQWLFVKGVREVN